MSTSDAVSEAELSPCLPVMTTGISDESGLCKPTPIIVADQRLLRDAQHSCGNAAKVQVAARAMEAAPPAAFAVRFGSTSDRKRTFASERHFKQ